MSHAGGGAAFKSDGEPFGLSGAPIWKTPHSPVLLRHAPPPAPPSKRGAVSTCSLLTQETRLPHPCITGLPR